MWCRAGLENENSWQRTSKHICCRTKLAKPQPPTSREKQVCPCQEQLRFLRSDRRNHKLSSRTQSRSTSVVHITKLPKSLCSGHNLPERQFPKTISPQPALNVVKHGFSFMSYDVHLIMLILAHLRPLALTFATIIILCYASSAMHSDEA